MKDPIKLSVLNGNYSVCRLPPTKLLPQIEGSFFSITKTHDELSFVVAEGFEPNGSKTESGWKILKVHGPLDFGLTGILNSLTFPLAQAGISTFAISTFDTDYLLIKQDNLDQALKVLKGAGHSLN